MFTKHSQTGHFIPTSVVGKQVHNIFTRATIGVLRGLGLRGTNLPDD